MEEKRTKMPSRIRRRATLRRHQRKKATKEDDVATHYPIIVTPLSCERATQRCMVSRYHADQMSYLHYFSPSLSFPLFLVNCS